MILERTQEVDCQLTLQWIPDEELPYFCARITGLGVQRPDTILNKSHWGIGGRLTISAKFWVEWVLWLLHRLCPSFVFSEFDSKKPVTMRSFVTKIEWTNPHVWFYDREGCHHR
jgi:hypothetical protein